MGLHMYWQKLCKQAAPPHTNGMHPSSSKIVTDGLSQLIHGPLDENRSYFPPSQTEEHFNIESWPRILIQNSNQFVDDVIKYAHHTHMLNTHVYQNSVNQRLSWSTC